MGDITFIRGPKTGRNDPCPCGSGQKYKRCCLAKDEAAAREAVVTPEATLAVGGSGAAERALAQIGQLLEGREFGSLEEVNAFIHGALEANGGRMPDRVRHLLSPAQKAQELMYDAWETEDPVKRVELALKALGKDPDCVDALLLLAEEAEPTPRRRLDVIRSAVSAGEAQVADLLETEVGHFWGILETRPYMRALAALADELWRQGKREPALDRWREMLRLNPGDNQGVRYLLLCGLLVAGRHDERQALLDRYDDAAATWLYGRALHVFLAEGASRSANIRLTKAMNANPHVVEFLTGRRRLPRQLPEYVSDGTESEAVETAFNQRQAWREADGALEWLAERAAKRRG